METAKVALAPAAYLHQKGITVFLHLDDWLLKGVLLLELKTATSKALSLFHSIGPLSQCGKVCPHTHTTYKLHRGHSGLFFRQSILTQGQIHHNVQPCFNNSSEPTNHSKGLPKFLGHVVACDSLSKTAFWVFSGVVENYLHPQQIQSIQIGVHTLEGPWFFKLVEGPKKGTCGSSTSIASSYKSYHHIHYPGRLGYILPQPHSLRQMDFSGGDFPYQHTGAQSSFTLANTSCLTSMRT